VTLAGRANDISAEFDECEYVVQHLLSHRFLIMNSILCLLIVLGALSSAVSQGENPNPGGYVDNTVSGAQLTNGEYPMTTLSCYSSYTKPDGMLICPEARSKFCVKELSTLKQDLCGESQFFGDQYLDNLCVLRKCSAECEEGQYPFEYGGLEYVRQRYCCQENYCNSSQRISSTLVISLSLLSAVMVSLFLFMY
jgi:hypothetical protein